MGEPLEIHVTYRKDDYTKELEAKLAQAEARANRAEYKYRCESVINGQLTDLLREHGIKYRDALRTRPWSDP